MFAGGGEIGEIPAGPAPTMITMLRSWQFEVSFRSFEPTDPT